jgi:hypothetical protein
VKIVAADETGQGPDPERNPLFAELLFIHSLIRRDLDTVELLARDAAGLATPDEVRERLGELKASTMLWQLRYGCLNYCRFVHGHHGLEDAAVFPAVGRVNPELNPVLERLQAEHRQVAEILHEVEAVAEALGEEEDQAARRRLVDALERLREVLLAHLDFEEVSLESTLARMRTWTG